MWNKKNFKLGKIFWKMLKYFNTFEHQDIWSKTWRKLSDWFQTQIRNEYMEQKTIRSVLWSVPFCWNISTILSIQISDQILKKTAWLVSETQVRNEFMEQETIRSILWSVPFCWNNNFKHQNICMILVRVVSFTLSGKNEKQ